MSKQAVFTMKLEPELRAEFMAEAEAAHRPASQVLRELMREFVQRQRESRSTTSSCAARSKPAGLRCALDWGGRTMKLRPNSPHGVPVWRARREVVWTPEAQQDRADVWDYIAADNPRAAARMDEIFSDAAARLIQHPMLGKPGKIPGTRELIPHESYRLVYQIDGETVWILTLVHTARLWPPVRD